MKIYNSIFQNIQSTNSKSKNRHPEKSFLNKEKDCSNIQNKIQCTLNGLASFGQANVFVSKNNKANLAENSTKNKPITEFKSGFAYDKNGELYTGEIIKVNSTGDKFNILIEDGKIKQSTKILKNGTIAWVKKYSKNEFGQNVTHIFKPNEDNKLKLTQTILTSKEKVAMFKEENIVDKYWFNTPQGWKRVDDFIDKSDISAPMFPLEYYTYNGIQINRFLRDGEFGDPNIHSDRIHYEYLEEPDCPTYLKEEIEEIMKDNRFILDTIDELDLLTRTSRTKAPMTVYRNAPYWWVNQSEDGILHENAFCSTSTQKGASMEGLYVGKHHKDGVIYTIHLPKGTPFLNLTNTNEKEMLLPRKGIFKVLGKTELEYIPQ